MSLRASWVSLGVSWGLSGVSWMPLGASWVPLGSSWVSLGASWVSVGFSGGSLGASWVLLGDPLEPCSAILKFPRPRRAGRSPIESAAVGFSQARERVKFYLLHPVFKFLLHFFKVSS